MAAGKNAPCRLENSKQIKTIMSTDTSYNELYRLVQQATLYMIVHGNINTKTHTGKQDAISELILRNTLLLSEISVARKSLEVAVKSGCQIEVSYFKKLLAFHCYDMLYPLTGGIKELIAPVVDKFSSDL